MLLPIVDLKVTHWDLGDLFNSQNLMCWNDTEESFAIFNKKQDQWYPIIAMAFLTTIVMGLGDMRMAGSAVFQGNARC